MLDYCSLNIEFISESNNKTMDDEIQLYKIVLIGNSGTGKTNISTRYIKGEFQENLQASVGAQFQTKNINVRGKNIKITLWDTAGQQRFKSLSKVYYKGARGIIAVYDITDPQSYVQIGSWLRLANEAVNLSQITVIVVGNKSDLQQQRKVTFDRALKQYKQEFDVDCWQVSAKTGHNINQLFNTIFDQIYQKSIDVKNSVFFASDVVTYSELQRDSIPLQKRKSKQIKQLRRQKQKEMMPIGQVIIEQQNEDVSRYIKKQDLPNFESKMTLIEPLQLDRKKRNCCK